MTQLALLFLFEKKIELLLEFLILLLLLLLLIVDWTGIKNIIIVVAVELEVESLRLYGVKR